MYQTLGVFIKYIRWFLQEGLAPINLIVEDKFHRATPGGTGGVKTIGNYASVILLYYCVVQVIEATALLFLSFAFLTTRCEMIKTEAQMEYVMDSRRFPKNEMLQPT